MAAEGGQGFKYALLVADIGVNAVQQRHHRVVRRHLEAGVGHHGQEAHGFQGDGLAAGVGAGDDQHWPTLGDADRGGNHVTRQQRVTPADDLHALGLARVQQNGRHGPQRCRVAPLGRGQVQTRQQAQHQGYVVRVPAHHFRQLAQHPFLFPLLRQAGLAPAVAQVDGRHGFDEHRGPAVGHVVHDAGSLPLELRLDEQHHPSVALGDDILLDDAGTLVPAQRPLHHVVERRPGRARFSPQAGQLRRRFIQHLAPRPDGAIDGALQIRQFGQVLGDCRQHGQVVAAGQGVAVPAGRRRQRAHVTQFLAAQHAA